MLAFRVLAATLMVPALYGFLYEEMNILGNVRIHSNAPDAVGNLEFRRNETQLNSCPSANSIKILSSPNVTFDSACWQGVSGESGLGAYSWA